ncbi:MAG TPA: helix-turn-helix transcriptional regulator, partial [Chthoniobacteraceae bacterium]|nr:helix-turn-helix transcriptional regulator [Chthoniobacteraceae bacterium]
MCIDFTFSDKGVLMKESSTKSVIGATKKVAPPEDFSKRVKSVRSKLGMTQEQMAVALGITKGYVWSIEKGEKRPSQKVVSKLDALELPSTSSASTPRTLLKAAREAKGMTQKDLARATGYGIGYIQALEDAGARLSEKFAEKVASVLGLEKEDLMRGSDQVPSLGVGEGTVGSISNVVTTDGIKAKNIPLISMAQAG